MDWHIDCSGYFFVETLGKCYSSGCMCEAVNENSSLNIRVMGMLLLLSHFSRVRLCATP